MAVIPPVVVQQQTLYGHTWVVTWTPITNADTCGAVQLSQAADRSIHALGTFNAASVAVQGSNETGLPNGEASVTSFVALTNPQGTAVAITSAGISEISEVTNWVKPVVTGGGGSQSLTIAMMFRAGI